MSGTRYGSFPTSGPPTAPLPKPRSTSPAAGSTRSTRPWSTNTRRRSAAQGRFAEAVDLLDQAIVLYREVNEPHFQGRSLITKGLVLQYAGETDLAADDFRNGLFLIHPANEPRLVLIAHYGLIHCANDNGRYAEARSLIQEARPVWNQVGKQLDLVRLRWLEGKVSLGLGQHHLAEQAFLEVRNEFIAAEIAHDVALASLDLAGIYARQGRLAEVKRLAAEMLPIFQARDVPRETLAALICFQQAAEMEQITLSMVEEVAAYLKTASHTPGLVFRGGEETGTAASAPA
jgi:tetratricopeptide (TPR) repeat protein